MLETIAVIANVVTILAGIQGIRELRVPGEIQRKRWLVVAGVSAVCGVFLLVYLISLHARPSGVIYTTLSEFDGAYYSGEQLQHYIFPTWFRNGLKEVDVQKVRGECEDGPKAIFDAYALNSSGQSAAVKGLTAFEYKLKSSGASQHVRNVFFKHAMSVDECGQMWHQPKGWSGFNYSTRKLYPANELIFLVDFRRIGEDGREVVGTGTPRYLSVSDINNKPGHFPTSDEAVLQNEFTEMEVVPDTNNLVWYARIENPPLGRVLVRWAP